MSDKIENERMLSTFDKERYIDKNKTIPILLNRDESVAVVEKKYLDKTMYVEANYYNSPMTERFYGDYIRYRYPLFATIKRILNLDTPKKTYSDKDCIGIFVYNDVFYIAAPVVE